MTNDYGLPPIQTQPQTPWQPANGYQGMYTPSTASAYGELQNLTTIQEIILKDEVFQTRDGKPLFTIHHDIVYPRASLNLCLRDFSNKDVVRLDLISNNGPGGQNSYVQIVALPMQPLGYVRITSVSGNLNICIQMTEDTSTFIANLPMGLNKQRNMTMEILNMNGSHQVAKITSEVEGKPAHVVFQFPQYLSPGAKTVILGAFLYLNFHLHQTSRPENTTTNFQDIELLDGVDRSGWSNDPYGIQTGDTANYSNEKIGRCCKCGPECMKVLCGLGSVVFLCANLASCIVNCVSLWRMCPRT
ncbi:uncharacterized protein ACNLHF_017795 isoform 1-T2 [Anomaloglossus baeobatrachus]|uniref:uncharacterized protein LOC142304400 isoform X1 n=1 Tax=Anomaloglossus baeobatrachus TaxID=238106 RepID=UPI003F505675